MSRKKFKICIHKPSVANIEKLKLLEIDDHVNLQYVCWGFNEEQDTIKIFMQLQKRCSIHQAKCIIANASGCTILRCAHTESLGAGNMSTAQRETIKGTTTTFKEIGNISLTANERDASDQLNEHQGYIATAIGGRSAAIQMKRKELRQQLADKVEVTWSTKPLQTKTKQEWML